MNGRDVNTTERLEIVAIDRLIPYARNARTHSNEQILQLRASLREFGFVNPVLVDRDYNIIAGHGRVIAAKAENITEVPCVFVEHLSETQKRAYVLADNRLALNAGWDEAMLAVELEELEDLNFDIDLTGFDADELAKLLSEVDAVTAEAHEDDFDADAVAAEIETPTTQRGDVWLLGRHRLMCGDSTIPEDVTALMDGAKARCVFTDPPWNVDYGADNRHPSWKSRQILNDKMSTVHFGAFLVDAFQCMAMVSESGCMTYVVMSAQEWGNVMNAMREAGYHWSSTIIWAKDSLVLSRKDYHTQYEPIYYGWLDGGKRLCPLEDRKQSDLWQIPRPKVSPEHPTMKPVALVAKALQNSSRDGDVVLDLFGGSGTTMIAAEQLGRESRLMELDPKYCDVIVRRFVELVGKDDGVFLLRGGEKIPHANV
ncbi:MAG: site-specific DNA-methyltransferase [Defluviitaleaceae bacterium]|nr:site-specific DNA-methyltransferase [Defluviitaleaceae bacterium]MCL2261669.1 site-specific DNA-methyltransferase [Defluviitaleaceae bacterium]